MAWQDLRGLIGLLAGGAAASVLPRGWDPGVARLLIGLYERLFPRTIPQLSGRMQRDLPPNSNSDTDQAARELILMRLEDMWGRARGLRKFGWQPEVEIKGLDKVKAALERGRGAIIWCMRFSSATALKQAFYHENLPLVHLSQANHGTQSETRFAVNLYNPLFCRAENPYLAERVTIPLDGGLQYIHTLKKHLKRNACVSIFGEHGGRQNEPARILGKPWHFALGAPSLAWSAHAALFTAYPLRTGPFRYTVFVDDEIPVDRGQDRKTFARCAVQEFAGRLEKLVIKHPGDWQGWFYDREGADS